MVLLWPITSLLAYIDGRLLARYEVKIRLKELM